MKFLELLYGSYYNFQIRVGNRDLAPFTSMLIIAFTLMLYSFAIFFLAILFLPKEMLDMMTFQYFSIFLLFFLIIIFYFILVNKGKYKLILKRNENNRRNRIISILFPLIAFLLFNLGWILKMLQNQGRL